MIIRRASLAAALPVTDSSDSRYFVTAIRCAPGVTEATNGKMAVRLTDRAPFPAAEFPETPGIANHDEPVLLPSEAVTSALKAIPKKTTIPVLGAAHVGKQTANGQAVTLTTTDLQSKQSIEIRTEEKTFPDIDRVMPKIATDATVDRLSVKLGVDLLEALLKAIKASDMPKYQPTVTLTLDVPPQKPMSKSDSTPDPHRVTENAIIARWTGADIDGLAVIMPYRM